MDSRTMPGTADALRDHGGNINAARLLYPHAPEPWIDLSTGINPRAYPIGRVSASAWARLPDAFAIAALEDAARAAYGAGSAAAVVAAPGTQALIQWLPRVFPARRARILGDTYGEHARSWEAAGCAVSQACSLPELAEADVGVVVNPNNPDGRLLPPDGLLDVAARLAMRGGFLVVDEAFMDVIGPASSVVPRLPAPGVVVLRSLGKAYGLAGLRLGFALASPALCGALYDALGPWAVSGPAVEIGRRALEDRVWLDRQIIRLSREARRLDRLLRSAGFTILGGTPLFRLARHPDAAGRFQALCRAGILTRPFAVRPDALRLGIPQGPRAWARLEAVLREPRIAVEDACREPVRA